MTFPLLRQKGRKSCSNKSNGWALQLVAVLCVAIFWIQRVLDKYCHLSLMMCHEVTGNLAEKISFLEYEARLAMMCFSIEVQLSPPPDPIPHRALYPPFPSSAYQQDKKQNELCCSARWHTCADCLGQAQEQGWVLALLLAFLSAETWTGVSALPNERQVCWS